jgi:hypothetical protein
MAVLKEIVAIVGKYTDREGKEKNQYQNMGKLIETQGGKQMIKIDCIPIGFDGWAYLNDPRPRDEQPQRQQAQSALQPDDTDGGDIPF